MIRFRTSILAALLGFAALASSPAQANLIIGCTGQSGCSANLANDPTNTFINFTGTLGSFNINALSITGVNAFGGNGLLMDNGQLDVSTAGTGSLQIFLTETNLTGSQIINFFGQFTATDLTNMSATRTFWLDPNNGGAEVTKLGFTTGSNGTFNSLQDLSLHAKYSLTEEVDLTANGPGATISADDKISVPEPMSLSLLGTGLLAFGAINRRRRKAAKKA